MEMDSKKKPADPGRNSRSCQTQRLLCATNSAPALNARLFCLIDRVIGWVFFGVYYCLARGGPATRRAVALLTSSLTQTQALPESRAVSAGAAEKADCAPTVLASPRLRRTFRPTQLFGSSDLLFRSYVFRRAAIVEIRTTRQSILSSL